MGFAFAIVLQVAQMGIGTYFTAEMQSAAVRVSRAVNSGFVVGRALDAVRELRRRLASDLADATANFDPAVYAVYLDALAEQRSELQVAAQADGAERYAPIDKAMAATRTEWEGLQRLARQQEPVRQMLRDAADFIDDGATEIEQAWLRMQIEVQELAREGVHHEAAVHNLPIRASVAITVTGVVLMTVFLTWFSRQLVVPIRRAWDELESRVASRTAELADTVQLLERQMEQRRRVEEQKEDLHRQLVDSSRRAGMAELANGVLHNVGNVLTSVKVAVDLLQERLRGSRVDGLQKVVQMLGEHRHDLGRFFTESPKGTRLPAYLDELGRHLVDERRMMIEETAGLGGKVTLLEEIVGRQQAYASVAGTTSATRASALLSDALAMQTASFAASDIDVITKVAYDATIEIDRTRVLQILMNLIGNARQAIEATGRGHGVLRLEVCVPETGRMRICVVDDGIGIEPGNLTRIFGHGFTTKRNGHGFGLHHSANAAAEMGGRLWAESEGAGRGATFVLELPVREVSVAVETSGETVAAAVGAGA